MVNGDLGGMGNINGVSQVGAKTIELCGGPDNKILFSEAATHFLAINYIQVYTVNAFLTFSGNNTHI